MPIWEETPGQTQDALERFYLSAGLGTSRCPPGGVDGSSRGEEYLDVPASDVAPVTWTQISDRKRDGMRTVLSLSFLMFILLHTSALHNVMCYAATQFCLGSKKNTIIIMTHHTSSSLNKKQLKGS